MSSIIDFIKNIQPSSKKQEKKEILAGKLLDYLILNDLTDDESDLLFTGDLDNKGLIQLSGMTNAVGQFKGSSKSILQLIHKLITEGQYKDKYAEKLSLFDDFISTWMKLSDYYKIPEFKSIVIDILLIIKSIRSSLSLEELGIKPNLTEEISKEMIKKQKQNKAKEEETLSK